MESQLHKLSHNPKRTLVIPVVRVNVSGAALVLTSLLISGILFSAQAQTQAESPAATSSQDITWITTPLLQLLGTLILAIGTWAIKRLLDWLQLKISAQASANLDQALEKAVTFGIQQAQETI